jgi:alpha-L-fucosidase
MAASTMTYTATLESLRSHELPAWYDDAKLGIFLHWGLYSVPGWAPQVADIQTLFRDRGPSYFFRNNPYAEWYLNSLNIDGSPTQDHHRQVYGDDYPYYSFRERFDAESGGADLDGLADLCRRSGARYVVLTTKHHDGFCLWPSKIEHPTMPGLHARRDLVGDLTGAVRDAGMRMGLYYSAGYDWSFERRFIRTGADGLFTTPVSRAYADYCDAHLDELIDRYQPSVLWNDIRYPVDADLYGVFARYYNAVPDGVVNDRWLQAAVPGGRTGEVAARALVRSVEAMWRLIPTRYRELENPRVPHCDFTTPEYAQHDEIVPRKWESTRGVGHSFGANRNERPEDILTVAEAVHSFVDIVSKGGNLLIGIGPMPDGTIPAEQQPPVLGLGEWLRTCGEAIYGTRPWQVPQLTATDGTEVRFTRTDSALYAILLGGPATRQLEMRGLDGASTRTVTLLGGGELEWLDGPEGLVVTMPERVPVAPALALRIEPAPAYRG